MYMYVCVLLSRGKFNRNYNYHNQHRQQATQNWNSSNHWYNRNLNVEYTPRWRWLPVNEPNDSRSGSNRPDTSYSCHESGEPSAKRHAPSRSSPTSPHPAAEKASPSDSLANKLTERTSKIISNVLSGKDATDAEKRPKSTPVQADRSSSGGGQPKRPPVPQLPSNKPKNAGGGSGELSDTSRPKVSTPSGQSNAGNVSAAGRVESSRVSASSSADVLLSPNSRSASEARTSLVRMATAPRSRREQLELERMLHEHTKKSAASKERMNEVQSLMETRLNELQSSAAGTAMNSATTNAQSTTLPSQVSIGRPPEITSSGSADNVIVVDAEPGNAASTAKKSQSSKKKSQKNAKVPAKTAAKSKAVPKKTKKRKSNNDIPVGQKKAQNPPTVPRAAYPCVRPMPAQGSSQFNLDSLIGSLGLPPNLVQGLVASQNAMMSSTMRAAASSSGSPGSSQAVDRGPLNALLEMSLHEENLCSRLSQCSSEIEQLQKAIAELDREVQKRIQLKTTVSRVPYLS